MKRTMLNRLQVFINDNWQWVFCWNDRTGIVTTKDAYAALPGTAIDYFQNKSNCKFRVYSGSYGKGPGYIVI